jgi:metallo-beta-lactamase family protein
MNLPVIHLGGEKCVTGACHLFQVQGMNILVDCGMAQGHDRALPLSNWPVKVSDLDFVFLTHAHVDHIGRLPNLVEAGFQGEIICSHPTKALLAPMLRDAMRFGEFEESAAQRIGHSIEELSWGFEYNQVFELGKGVTFKLGRTGHILGSCFIRFESRRDNFSVCFSGDLGNPGRPLLPDPDPADPVDFLVLESTYGNRLHETHGARAGQLAAILNRCLSDGGIVYIPAFALGRTQEILYELDRIFSTPEFFKTYSNLTPEKRPPVFIDSPLGLSITEIYSKMSAFWDQEARDLIRGGDNPIDFGKLFAVQRYDQHAQLLDFKGPAIVIAGSGMYTGGRIVDHLLAGIEDPRNDILFVGYMADGTPGREIQEKAKEKGRVVLDGASRQVRAGVHVLSGYSAHADQQGLLDWVAGMGEKPRMIRLVHGDGDARRVLGAKLMERGYVVG